MKFRKKPVVIEAEQFQLGHTPYPAGVVPVIVSAKDPDVVWGAYSDRTVLDGSANVAFGIRELEGWHVVTHGDWIITGVKGERYACKPDIFALTYEAVEP